MNLSQPSYVINHADAQGAMQGIGESWADRMVEKGGAAKAGDIVVRIGNSSDT